MLEPMNRYFLMVCVSVFWSLTSNAGPVSASVVKMPSNNQQVTKLDETPQRGILLKGPQTKNALSVVQDYSAPGDLSPLEIDVDATSGARVYRTQLKVALDPAATVKQVNDALTRVSGRIVGSFRGNPVLFIEVAKVKNQLDLQSAITALKSAPGFLAASRVFIPATKEIKPNSKFGI